jgi:hypothetical protein
MPINYADGGRSADHEPLLFVQSESGDDETMCEIKLYRLYSSLPKEGGVDVLSWSQ